MKIAEKNKISTLQLTELSILLALVVALQSISSFGVVNICLCLIPITLGAILLDWRLGGMLGFAFGLVAILWGVVGKDMFTFYLFNANPIMTILICLIKGSLAGIVPAFVYRRLKGYNPLVAGIAAGISAPVVNTGIFAIGCLVIQGDVIYTMEQLGFSYDPEAMSFFALLFGVIITANFFIELLINVIFAPSLHKLECIINERILKRI